jgi:hypothetical protein
VRIARVWFAAHAAGAAVAAWLAPHGFPVHHPRFWLHTVAPTLFAAACLAFLRWPGLGASALTGFWLATAAGLAALFAEEAWPLVVLTLLLAALVGASAQRLGTRRRFAAVGAAAGLLGPWGLRAPAPSTHPSTAPLAPGAVEVRGTQWVDLGTLTVQLDARMHRDDRSDRRFQTLFGPPPPPSATQLFHVPTPQGLHVHARTVVPEPAYAHLHTYAQLVVAGHRRLQLRFSPCPDVLVEPLPADYPWGRPQRFAVVDADRRFRVLQARTGEKGPYSQLCEGELTADAPLAIDLLDDGVLAGTLVAHDFAIQASTELSPSAGHGVPQNAVIFTRVGDDDDDAVWMHLGLASTGIGIGWDSVGVAAGVYDARFEVRPPQATR